MQKNTTKLVSLDAMIYVTDWHSITVQSVNTDWKNMLTFQRYLSWTVLSHQLRCRNRTSLINVKENKTKTSCKFWYTLWALIKVPYQPEFFCIHCYPIACLHCMYFVTSVIVTDFGLAKVQVDRLFWEE